MSEVSQGPGWWLASDGRWYPPEQAPGYPASGWAAESPVSEGAELGSPAGPVDPAVMTPAEPAVPAFPPEPDPSAQPISSATGSGYGPPPGPAYAAPSAWLRPAVRAWLCGPRQGPATARRRRLRAICPPVDPAYGYPPGVPPYGYVPAQKTNGLAVASLVCSLVWLGGLGSILAIVFGIIAVQIRKAEGNVQGTGLALAGIIIGVVGLVAVILFVILVAVVVNHCDQAGNCTTNTFGN